jgi:hypothetical protein
MAHRDGPQLWPAVTANNSELTLQQLDVVIVMAVDEGAPCCQEVCPGRQQDHGAIGIQAGEPGSAGWLCHSWLLLAGGQQSCPADTKETY